MDYKENYINTVATIKTTNMLIKCPNCDQLICGYAPLVHKIFCKAELEKCQSTPFKK